MYEYVPLDIGNWKLEASRDSRDSRTRGLAYAGLSAFISNSPVVRVVGLIRIIHPNY